MQKNIRKIQNKTYFILVFQDQTNLAGLKFLKRGFRHCFLYQVNKDREIIKIESLSNLSTINIINNMNPIQLIDHIEKLGHTYLVLPKTYDAPQRIAPLLPLTCVEMVKRIIGLHSWRVLTPWQLYQHTKEQIMNINIDI